MPMEKARTKIFEACFLASTSIMSIGSTHACEVYSIELERDSGWDDYENTVTLTWAKTYVSAPDLELDELISNAKFITAKIMKDLKPDGVEIWFHVGVIEPGTGQHRLFTRYMDNTKDSYAVKDNWYINDLAYEFLEVERTPFDEIPSQLTCAM